MEPEICRWCKNNAQESRFYFLSFSSGKNLKIHSDVPSEWLKMRQEWKKHLSYANSIRPLRLKAFSRGNSAHTYSTQSKQPKTKWKDDEN